MYRAMVRSRWFFTRFAAGLMTVGVLSLLSGCSGGCGFLWFEPCDDLDSDGHTEAEGDCRDHDPSIYPGAEETPYDGIDQDCDGADLIDADGDGHVAEREGGDDCDDQDPSTYPDAEEVCDGNRNRCDDGKADDSDDDGDPREGCNSGYDCDDANPTIYRGAQEIPYDGIDQDCAGEGNGDEVDVDGDGEASVLVGGTDCADNDENRGGQDEVFIPAGVFVMGSDSSDEYANANEAPQHDVYLSGYCIDRYEVTNEEYRACAASSKCSAPAASSVLPSDYFVSYHLHPVLNVTWNQATEFCKSREQVLPTEAQWEKAARGGKCLSGEAEPCAEQNPAPQRLYPWGEETPSCEMANYTPDDGTACYGLEDHLPAATKMKTPRDEGGYLLEPVRPGSASSYDLYDMAGNASEWTYDIYGSEYYDVSEYNDPKGPDTGSLKTYRGGSYLNTKDALRTAARFSYNPTKEDDALGFRCARNVIQLALDNQAH